MSFRITAMTDVEVEPESIAHQWAKADGLQQAELIDDMALHLRGACKDVHGFDRQCLSIAAELGPVGTEFIQKLVLVRRPPPSETETK